ncbi:MAG: VWA domain-containing protein [Acidobacteria bacterium]|nr:VWA domain-containing protein [Acidobacteriota bacterium]
MFFFNLTAAEFFTLLGGISAFVTLLYLLDRSRKKHLVASLRFFQNTELPTERKHRRRIQQPWSLILQLVGIALLLLAIAQLRIGSKERNSRDHVLLVEASAWMNAKAPSGRSLMTETQNAALRYVRALPSSDRVMVVRADALATPLTGFENNRAKLEAAVRQTQPGTAGLHLGQGLDFASRALRMEGQRAGEIVFAGVGRMSKETLSELPPLPANLRLLPVKGEVDNIGLKKLSLRRATNDPEVWEIYLSVQNYSGRIRTIPLAVTFGGAPVATKRLTLTPGVEASENFAFRTRAAGWLEARIEPRDALPADDGVTLELPAVPSAKIVVYSNEPELLKPLIGAHKRMETVVRRPAEYKADEEAGIVILDRFQPSAPPKGNALWIEPPQMGSPIPVTTRSDNALLRWRSDQFLAEGLHTKNVRIESSEVFAAAAGDLPIAETDAGAMILARPGKTKTAVMGFHPMKSALRYELAAPILFANLLKWMAPDIFLRIELQAGTVGTVTVPLEEDFDPAAIRVITEQQRRLPFTIKDRALRFYSGAPGLVRVTLGDRELVYALSLPEVADSAWEPKNVRSGYTGAGGVSVAARDIWYWLALAGAVLLLIEFFLYGSGDKTPDAPLPQSAEEVPQRKAS